MQERQRFRLSNRGRVETPPPKAAAPGVAPHVTRARRAPRAGDILRAVADIDTATDPQTKQQLTAWLGEQYDLRGGGQLIGFFAACALGHPYVDHRMSVVGGILDHYTRGDQVPMPFDLARGLARSGAYLFIEIYEDGTIIPIRMSGEAVL